MTITADRRAAVVRDYLSGEATKIVAERYCVSAPSVLSWVRKAGGQVRGEQGTRRPRLAQGPIPVVDSVSSTPIEALHGTVAEGTMLALRRAGFVTVEQVAAATDEQLLQVRNLGVTKLAKMRSAVPDILEWSTSSAAPKRAVGRFYRELGSRGLLPCDVITIPGVWRLYRPELSEHRKPGITELVERVGAPAPEPLFAVGVQRYWLYDDILAWLAPLLARRWDRSYEMRRRDVVTRWKRSHARRRSSKPNRYGYQGVRRLNDSISSRRRWAASLGYQRNEWTLGYCATPEEAARLYDRGLIAIGERAVNFPDDVATTMLLPEPHIGPKVSVAKVLRQIVDKHGPIEASAVLDLLPTWPLQPTRPTTRRKASSVLHARLISGGQIVHVEGGWVPADRAEQYPPSHQTPRIRRTAGRQHKFAAEERAAAVAAYLSGEPSTQIAKRVGASHVAVLQWVRAAGGDVRPANPRTHPPELREAALDLYKAGAGAVPIARMLGLGSTTVLGWARAAGLPIRRRGGPTARPRPSSPSSLTSS